MIIYVYYDYIYMIIYYDYIYMSLNVDMLRFLSSGDESDILSDLGEAAKWGSGNNDGDRINP